MKIAVAVILAIASAHNGINPKPTMDLDFVEIGPDAVKEDIPGADVFKKAPDGGANEDQRIEVTLKAKECEPYPGKYMRGDQCIGELKLTIAVHYLRYTVLGQKETIYAKINGQLLEDDAAKNKMFSMMDNVSKSENKEITSEFTVKIPETLLSDIVNEALSK